MRIVFGFILLLLGSITATAQELVVNGGAEDFIWVGWHQANPSDTWKFTKPGSDNVRPPHGGTFLMYPYRGVSTTSELYQDIDISANAAAIDAGTASYSFSGWRRGFKNTSPFSADMDRSQIIVEYRDASGTVLGSFDTGSAVFSSWTQSTDTRFAPIGTRSIRIRLISVQVSGSENDGYYDDISLVYNAPTCTPPASVLLTPNATTSYCLGSSVVISGSATPTNLNYYYTWYKNGIAITTPSTTYAPFSKITSIASDAATYTLRVEDGNAGSATCYKESSVTIILDPPNIAGTISSNREICTATAPVALTGTAATGGTATKYYKWQQSTTSATGPWTTAQAYTIGATGYTPGTLSATTYFRRMDSSGTCAGVPTNTITITVDAQAIAGTISSNTETCANTIPAPFTGTTSTGGTATKYYKWERSTGTSVGPWVTVQAFNTTATGYTPTTSVALLAYYRRTDSSGTCANVPTNVITIKTKNPPPLDPITSLVRDTLCVGENFQLAPHIQGPGFPVSFNGGFYYSWRKIQGTTSTVVVPSSLLMSSYPTSATPAAVADSGTYYFIAQDGPGISQCKDSVKIVIRINQAPTTKALIQSNQEFCVGSTASQLIESSPAAGIFGNPVYHQWYTTTDTTGTPTLSKLSAATGTTYNPGTPATTKYYVRTDSVKYCAVFKTNFLKIRVNNKPVLDSIRATVNDTLCVNFGDQFQLKGYVDSLIAGKQSLNGGFYFTWKQLRKPATTAVVVSATGKYTDYPAISRAAVEADSGTYYLIVQDGPNAKECLDSISLKMVVSNNCIAVTCTKPDFVSIKVAATSSATLCSGNTLVLQKDVITLPSTLPTFGYTYSWVRTNTLGTVVVQPASTTYQDLIINSVSLIDSGRYQLIVKDGTTTPMVCSESSLPISVVVYKPVTAAHIGNDTTICIGNAVLPFIEVTSNTGGSGIYTYQWQSSSDNITFTNISSQTNATYHSPNIFTPTYFRRIDKSSTCAAIISDTISVATSAGVNPGTIVFSTTPICYNTAPLSPIANTANASGGTGGSGSETYQWQKSSDNIHWTNIAGATSVNYQETNPLTDTTYYRRKVGMGPGNCDTSYTVSTAINVYEQFTTGSIGSDQSICSGTSTTVSEITPATGYNLIYRWVQSINNGITWALAPGPWTTQTLTTPILTDTIWYKRVAFTSCAHDSSNIVKINVDTLSHPHASINDGLTCQSANIQLTAVATNAGIAPSYAWQKAASVSGPWTPIPAATTANYVINNPQPIDSGTVYKVIVTSSDVCNVGPDDTTVVLRVQKSVQPSVSISANPSGIVCDTLRSITYTAVSTGGGTAPTYQWYNGIVNTAIPGATNTTYTYPTSPADGDKVFVTMTSNANCATTATVTSTTYTLKMLIPLIVLTNADTVVCIPNTVPLTTTNTSSSGSTFQWYKDGIAISGATNKNYTVSASDFPGGIFNMTESIATCTSLSINSTRVTIIQPPVVSAGNDMTVQKNSVITLQGSVSGSTNYSWIPSTGLSNAAILNPDATITHTITYTLSALDPTGTCSAQSSVTIKVEDAVIIPNVITPNGDGANDTWMIENIQDYPNATFTIYNRWGNIVWKASGNAFQWDGTNYRNGELLADGTYFYIIDLQNSSYPEPYTGYVQLIK
ncbi:gliding motility-associated C-terminal domain-containing protein [Cytophaga aurantiaca]|uniref:gliding motility-associated C-terminal domain-containing protein n=1 Tax=Cytophaga aurantiaca TaxID=29530 RepID=UPI000381F8FB|nr:T9SS C-terminal target domain-containing protein [Cytophaga aurantiaca]